MAEDIRVIHGTVHSILKDEMKMSKVRAQWVPRLLSTEEKKVRIRYLFTVVLAHKVVVVLLFYVHGKHLRSCRDGQLT